MPHLLTVFLDSNVLFSTCYKTPNLFEKIWQISSVRIVTSKYCIDEVGRNLRLTEQLSRLELLVKATGLVDDCPKNELPSNLMLPAKDVPVIAAAARCHADVMITGDLNHFSRYFGHRVLGVLIESPSMFRDRFPEVFQDR